MHISAGAIIYKKINNELFILLMHRKKTDSYHFAKGTQEAGETNEQTALREIKEETNCDVVLENDLGFVLSTFLRYGQIVEKKTHYFVARYTGGQLQAADGEHDTVDFYPMKTAQKLLQEKGGHTVLGYENELAVLQKFEQMFFV